MRLLTYRSGGKITYGAVMGDGIVDLGAALGADFPDLKAIIAGGGMNRARAALEAGEPSASLEGIEYLPVIPNSEKILCVGLNYEDHRIETDFEPTGHPTLFNRWAECQCGHGQPMVLPRNSVEFDYEGELAVIIGRDGRHVDEADALDIVAGYSVYNDGSIRDWQMHTTQFLPGKNFDATGAFGPWMVTPDEVGDPDDLAISLRLNGETLQDSRTSHMIFKIPRLIAYISSFTTLRPGDVIVSGTPGGVGFTRTPPIFMKAGDVVEVEIEKVGVLRNPIVAEG